MNKQDIKDLIELNITVNGKKENTPQKVKQVLHAMVDSDVFNHEVAAKKETIPPFDSMTVTHEEDTDGSRLVQAIVSDLGQSIPASFDAVGGNQPIQNSSLVIDGDLNTFALCQPQSGNPSIELRNSSSDIEFSHVSIKEYGQNNGQFVASKFEIEYKNVTTNQWVSLGVFDSTGTPDSTIGNLTVIDLGQTIVTREIRITAVEMFNTSINWWLVREIFIYKAVPRKYVLPNEKIELPNSTTTKVVNDSAIPITVDLRVFKVKRNDQ